MGEDLHVLGRPPWEGAAGANKATDHRGASASRVDAGGDDGERGGGGATFVVVFVGVEVDGRQQRQSAESGVVASRTFEGVDGALFVDVDEIIVEGLKRHVRVATTSDDVEQLALEPRPYGGCSKDLEGIVEVVVDQFRMPTQACEQDNRGTSEVAAGAGALGDRNKQRCAHTEQRGRVGLEGHDRLPWRCDHVRRRDPCGVEHLRRGDVLS